MHGIIGRQVNKVLNGGGWTPYIPNLFTRREVWRQLGHKPTLYVMRKRDGWESFYRACTPEEMSDIETLDTTSRS